MVEPTTYWAVRMTGISTGNPHPVILKSGRPSMVKVVHHWTCCDVCSGFQLIHADDLKAQWKCPECKRTSLRKETPEAPVCKGYTQKGQKFPHPETTMTP